MSFLRRLAPVLLILAIGLAHVAALRPGHEWGDDFALYLLHARNLVEGQPYADTGYIYNPHYPSIGPPTYPPVTPLLLAPVYALVGLNLEAMKWMMVGGFMAFLGAAYLLFRCDLGALRSAVVIALLGLNWFFLQETNTIGSDEFFLGFLYLAFLLVERADRTTVNSPAQWLLQLGAGMAAYLAFGTRSLGVLVMVALAIKELIVRRRIGRPVLAGMALFACLALVQTLLVHSDRRYLDQLQGGPGVLVEHLAWYAERLAAFWSNGRWHLLGILLTAACLLLASAGFALRVRRRVGVCEVFALLYVAVILLWPSYEAERYLYPVIPLWIFYAFCGLEHPWLARRPVLGRTVFGLLLTGAALTYTSRYAASDWGPLAHGVHTSEAQELFRCVADRTRPGDVVLFAKPRAMALMTGRASASPYVPDHDEQLWTYLRSVGAAYLVVSNHDGVFGRAENAELGRFLRLFVARNGRRFTSLCANADFTVYRIDMYPREG